MNLWWSSVIDSVERASTGPRWMVRSNQTPQAAVGPLNSQMLFYSAEREDSLGTITYYHRRKWVKVGGDKGGGSFKMSFQFLHPMHLQTPSFLPSTSVTTVHQTSTFTWTSTKTRSQIFLRQRCGGWKYSYKQLHAHN